MMRRFPWILRCTGAIWLLASLSIAVAGDRFTDNGDGTVTDPKNHLMWASTDNQGDIDWRQADRWVRYTLPDTLTAAYTDWRLPTLDELRSIYVDDPAYAGYLTDCGMTVRIIPEIHLSCGWVWTSQQQSISAWGFHFNRGIRIKDRMVLKKGYRALAVRNIP